MFGNPDGAAQNPGQPTDMTAACNMCMVFARGAGIVPGDLHFVHITLQPLDAEIGSTHAPR